MKDKYYVLVLQENYEYYDCDIKTGQPVGDMVDHNYDAPYRYVVRRVDTEEDIADFDTCEGAVDYARQLNKDGELDYDYCDEKEMYEMTKYNGFTCEWVDLHIYTTTEEDMQELIRVLKEKE